MLRFWFPAYAVCLLYLLAAAIWPLLPLRLRRAPEAERQADADRLYRRMLVQFAVLFVVVDFMLMRTLCLMPEKDQQLAAVAVTVLQVCAAWLLPPSVRRGLQAVPVDDKGRSVAETAHAKVNLTLTVGEKRPDGYHEVETVMTTVGLCDTVTVVRHPGIQDQLICDTPVTARVEDNLCMKALRLFFQELGVKEDFVTITLEKRIPAQAGLGGGSSDAAAVLRALRTLYAPDISDGRLETLAARLGSDVPFFIRGGTQLATGRGEVVSPLPQLAAGWFVVVKPDEGYSTAEMYRRLDEPGSVLVRNSRYMQDAVAANNVHAVAAELHNSFERVVPKDSSLRTIKDALRAQGALGTLLSGSGSAVFGLFDDQSAAAAAAEALKKTWPWVFVARPV